MAKDSLLLLCDRLGYRFQDPELLRTALTHRSVDDRAVPSNERLEFLGDAVLGLAVARSVYRRMPYASEGVLTGRKARFVNNVRLSESARSLGLGSFVRLGKGEEKNGGRMRPRLLADTLEAVLGAVYLDGGMEAASWVVERWILAQPHSFHQTSKTDLQEWLQCRGAELPEYVLIEEEGPPHDRTFVVEARSGTHAGRGKASRKKRAEQRAAAKLLESLVATESASS